MNKEIENSIDKIIEFIKNTDSYKNYIRAREILDTKDDIKRKIEEIKKYQKEIINSKGKKEQLESKIKENLKYIEEDITYNCYKKSLDDVNNMLIIFENKINKYFEEVFH